MGCVSESNGRPHFQFLLIKITFSLALLHGPWFHDNLQIWSQWINKLNTIVHSYFIVLRMPFESIQPSAQHNGPHKNGQHPLHTRHHFVPGVSKGIVTLGHFSFDYNGAACKLSPCVFSSESIPKARINERRWRAGPFFWQGENTASAWAWMPAHQAIISAFRLRLKTGRAHSHGVWDWRSPKSLCL